MLRWLITPAITLLLCGCATTRPVAPAKCVHAEAAIELDIGYCQAVRAGDLVFISGNVGKGDMRLAMQTAYDNVQQGLAAFGLGFRDVVKETVFTTNLDEFKNNRDVRRPYFEGVFPAATWVQIQRLYSPAAVVEVEVTALIPTPRR